MTTDRQLAAQIRAHQLSAALARRGIALLEAVPAAPRHEKVRSRIQRSAGIVITEASRLAPEQVRLYVDASTPPGLPGITPAHLHRVTTHSTASLGRTLADVFDTQEEERERLLARASALRVGTMRGLLHADRLHRAAIEHMVDALAVFEVIPVRRGADFDATLAHVARSSGFAPVPGGYKMLNSRDEAAGRLVTHDALGVGRSRSELEAAADENADETEEWLELILALLWVGSGSDGVDSMLDEADTLGLQLDDPDPTGAPDIDLDEPDGQLRWRWRRAVHLHSQIVARREEARQISRRKQAESEARARHERLTAELEARRRAAREANRRAAEAEIRNMRLSNETAWADADPRRPKDSGPEFAV